MALQYFVGVKAETALFSLLVRVIWLTCLSSFVLQSLSPSKMFLFSLTSFMLL